MSEIVTLSLHALAARLGARAAFDVRGERSARVRFEGPVADVEGLTAGAGSGEGKLVIDGDAERRGGA